MAKVALAMSGGVDSSVALHLLREKGYDVVGVHMKTFPDIYFDFARYTKKKVCCSPEDTFDAMKVAKEAGVEFHVLRFGEIFETHVVDYFVDTYAAGCTPNPCAFCNRYLKFGAMMDEAMKKFDCEFFATGHYAQVEYVEKFGKYMLKMGRDRDKDQSYFLSLIEPERLSRILFPLGQYTKEEIRTRARNLRLHVSEKKESQEICFVPYDDIKTYLMKKLGIRKGPIKDLEGKVLGEHEGFYFYTVGQRKGLKVSAGKRLYVHHVVPAENTVVVAERDALMASNIVARNINMFLKIEELEELEDLRCKVRNKSQLAAVKEISILDDQLKVKLKKPVFAVTPGQIVTVYWREYVIMAGIIEGWE